MSEPKTSTGRRIAFNVFLATLSGVLLYAYFKYVYGHPTLAWQKNGKDFELLSPRMLGIALIAPYFLWFIARSLADLPWPQRVVSALLRIAFVTLLALGLSRLAETATESRVCTVFMVDVSESVPDEAIADAPGEPARSGQGSSPRPQFQVRSEGEARLSPIGPSTPWRRTYRPGLTVGTGPPLAVLAAGVRLLRVPRQDAL